VNIYLRDHAIVDEGNEDWLKCLMNVNGFHQETQIDGYNPDQGELDDKLRKDDVVIFVHADNELVFGRWRQWTLDGEIKVGRLIRISREGIGVIEQDGIVACWWKPDDFAKVHQAKEFLRLLNEGSFHPELLRPHGVPPIVLAYLLARHYGCGVDGGELEQAADSLQELAKSEFRTISQDALDSEAQINPSDEQMKKLVEELSARE